MSEVRNVAVNDLVVEGEATLRTGWRLAHLVGTEWDDHLELAYVFLAGGDRRLEFRLRVPLDTPRVPSLSSLSFPAGRLERLVRDQFGVEFSDHVDPRPLLRHGHWPSDVYPLRTQGSPVEVGDDAAPYPFTRITTPGSYEIPVGPVHAGLIEPGHFRFSVVGETILHLSPRLWFVHRGLERLAQGRSIEEVVRLAEVVSGDSAVAHSLACLMAVEDALGVELDEETCALRQGLVELERVTHHVADLGALANDVGYSVGAARALRLVDDLQRTTASITGHRLGRGALRLGGVQWRDQPPSTYWRRVTRDVGDLSSFILAHSIVRDRFEGTGVVASDVVTRLGVVGLIARASGCRVDARHEHPWGREVTLRTQSSGDVRARFDQRVAEALDSLQLLEHLADGHQDVVTRPPREATGVGVGVVEGWRGAVVHRVTLEGSTVRRWAPIDPSFFNWPALAPSLGEAIVADFPLINKSFNLSYAGNDL